jgi:hypothetical protein
MNKCLFSLRRPTLYPVELRGRFSPFFGEVWQRFRSRLTDKQWRVFDSNGGAFGFARHVRGQNHSVSDSIEMSCSGGINIC